MKTAQPTPSQTTHLPPGNHNPPRQNHHKVKKTALAGKNPTTSKEDVLSPSNSQSLISLTHNQGSLCSPGNCVPLRTQGSLCSPESAAGIAKFFRDYITKTSYHQNIRGTLLDNQNISTKNHWPTLKIYILHPNLTPRAACAAQGNTLLCGLRAACAAQRLQ